MRRGGKPYRNLAAAAGYVACVAAGLTLPAAQAQPIRLIPQSNQAGSADSATPPAPNAAPGTLPGAIPQANTPPAGAPAAAVQPDSATPSSAQPGGNAAFVIQPLQAPDASTAGLLDDSNGGLGATMWQGTDQTQAARAIGSLPDAARSFALRDLQRRLLLTTAQVPAGTPGTPSLLGLRIAQLYRLGDVSDALQLATPKPAGLKDPILDQLPVDVALLKGDLPQACERVAQGLQADASAYWQKANVLCRYLAKDYAGGDLALSLWRDAGGNDPAFNVLAAALRGDSRAKVETLGGASALHFAMLRAAGRPLPKDALDVAPPALLAAMAGYDKADAEQRLAAAEQAAAFGALPVKALGEAYAAMQIPDAVRAAMASGKTKDTTPRAAAYLYQSAQSTEEAKTRIDLLQRAWALAQTRDLQLPTALLYKPMLAGLAPDEGFIAAAPAIIRMALAAGEPQTARAWAAMLAAQPAGRDKAAELAARAWPMLLLAASPDTAWDDSRFTAWLATQGDLTPAERSNRAALLLALAEGAGIAVPAERWDALLADAPAGATGPARQQPALAVWRNLLRSVSANARAESVALALALLGPDGTAQADGQSLATALGALRSVGLTDAARAVALEAALLRGF